MDSNTTTSTDVLATLLRQRYSCRAFRPDPVGREVIREIVADATHAPSWCNTQPWQLIVTDGEETERLRKALYRSAETDLVDAPDLPFPAAYEGAYRDRRRECGRQLYESIGVPKHDRAASHRQLLENFALFGAPHVAVLTTDRSLGVYGAVDCGLFVQSFLLAAGSRGVATVPQAAMASQAPFLREWFDIPQDRLILLGISFGYPDEEHAANGFRTARVSADEVITWAGDRR
ncbi:nitroreductase [Nocardia alni]|uniref:nitroreductase n=1 Tax=Nocardia alni TaxID=2815723 RepID=UPI001C212300|nr:nitroreductase [Nocardia alni]